jgi:lipoprotein signal peptidase
MALIYALKDESVDISMIQMYLTVEQGLLYSIMEGYRVFVLIGVCCEVQVLTLLERTFVELPLAMPILMIAVGAFGASFFNGYH